jgi:hypothetical protein
MSQSTEAGKAFVEYFVVTRAISASVSIERCEWDTLAAGLDAHALAVVAGGKTYRQLLTEEEIELCLSSSRHYTAMRNKVCGLLDQIKRARVPGAQAVRAAS